LTIVFVAYLIKLSLSASLKKKEEQSITIKEQQPLGGDEVALVDAFCFINSKSVVYDLNPLSREKADYTVENPKGELIFNICTDSIKKCPGKDGSVFYKSNLVGDNCVLLAGKSTVSSSFYKVENASTNKQVLRMKLPEGEPCLSDTSRNYQTIVEFSCDEDSEKEGTDMPPVINTSLGLNEYSCKNYIFVKSKHACSKVNVYALWNRIQDNKYAFGLLIIAVGIFFCFFGEEFTKISQVVAGAGATILIILYLVFNFTKTTLYSWQFWLILLFAVALGCLAGWFMNKIKWLPGVIFGALLGFVMGFFIFNLCLRYIQSNPAAVFWVTMVLLVIGGVLFGYFYEEEVAIISTGIVGAYAIIRGISIMAGGFPDERQVYELGQKREWGQMKTMLTSVVYAYLASFVILAAVGIIIQFKFFYDGNKNKKDQDKKDNKENKDQPLVDDA